MTNAENIMPSLNVRDLLLVKKIKRDEKSCLADRFQFSGGKEMRKILYSCFSLFLGLIMVTGCMYINPRGEFKDDDAVAEYVDTLLNSQYSKYFEDLELFCCEYGTNDDGVFYAIVYSEEEKYSFGADYA